MNKTNLKSEYLECDENILGLAKKVLSDEELLKAKDLSERVIQKKEKKMVVAELLEMIKNKPKRPLYYLEHELEFLPRWTRGSIKYLGDYIDILVKLIVLEKKAIRDKPLGANLNALNSSLEKNLLSKLKEYNDIFYVPGKHDFVVVNKHRFTSREVIYCMFITIKLAKELIPLSEITQDYEKQLVECDGRIFVGLKND